MQSFWDKHTLQPTAIGHLGYAQIPGDFLLTFKDPVSGTNSIQVWVFLCVCVLHIKLIYHDEFCALMEFQILF